MDCLDFEHCNTTYLEEYHEMHFWNNIQIKNYCKKSVLAARKNSQKYPSLLFPHDLINDGTYTQFFFKIKFLQI